MGPEDHEADTREQYVECRQRPGQARRPPYVYAHDMWLPTAAMWLPTAVTLVAAWCCVRQQSWRKRQTHLPWFWPQRLLITRLMCCFLSLSQAELDAHDSPIQCMEYCAARSQVATCGMGCKVKVWSLTKPSQPTLVVVLDHADPTTKQLPQAPQQQGSEHGSLPASPAAAASQAQGDSQGKAGGGGAADVNASGTSNMKWLIKSDAPSEGRQAGRREGPPLPAIVAQAIEHAAEDVPEVLQVRGGMPFAGRDGLLNLVR